jgi:two-component system, NarL family, nitrate/nitrite response regulator NarL
MEQPNPVRALLADSDEDARAALCVALEAAGFVIAAEAEDAASAIRAAAHEKPELCLVDLDLRGDGLKAIAVITRRQRAATVVALSGSADGNRMVAALDRGASGYLLKEMSADELSRSLRAALKGEPAIPRNMLPTLIEHVRSRPQRRISLPDGHGVELTVREWDVAALVRDDLTTSEIARRLGLSPVTVRRHLASIAAKLGAANRTEAVRLLKLVGR